MGPSAGAGQHGSGGHTAQGVHAGQRIPGGEGEHLWESLESESTAFGGVGLAASGRAGDGESIAAWGGEAGVGEECGGGGEGF